MFIGQTETEGSRRLSINVEARMYMYTYIHMYRQGYILTLLRAAHTRTHAYILRPRERDTVLESTNAVGK